MNWNNRKYNKIILFELFKNLINRLSFAKFDINIIKLYSITMYVYNIIWYNINNILYQYIEDKFGTFVYLVRNIHNYST